MNDSSGAATAGTLARKASSKGSKCSAKGLAKKCRNGSNVPLPPAAPWAWPWLWAAACEACLPVVVAVPVPVPVRFPLVLLWLWLWLWAWP